MDSKIDPAQTRLAQEFKHGSPLIGCRFDPSGRFVVAGAQDNRLVRWELDGGKKTELVGHQSWVRALAFHDKLLFSADYTGKVLVWEIEAETPTPVRTIEAHRGWVRALAVSGDGRTLASCGNDALVKLWSIPDGKPLGQLAGHQSHVYNVAFHPDHSRLASADLKGVVKDWDLARGKDDGRLVRDLDASVLYKYDPVFRADHGGVRSMAFRPDGSLLACAGITGVTNAFAGVGKPAVVLFDWPAGKLTHLLVSKEAFQGTMWGVVFHPAGFVAGAAGGSGGALFFWKPAQPQAFHTVKLPNNARDLDLHPDASRLAVPFFDNVLRIYDMTVKT